MSPLKMIIPLFIILGLLQAAVIAIPFMYWRFQAYMGPINKFIFGFLLLSTVFIIHPIVVVGLITFTIAPTLLSFRHNAIERAGTVYAAFMPRTLPALPALNNRLPKSNKEWLYTLLGGYAGWKLLGTLPSLLLLGIFLKRSFLKGSKVEERSIGVKSDRTDVQIAG